MRAFLLLLLPAIAAAQLTPNTVTVTASRDVTPAPDQVVFSVTINADTNATLDEVMSAAQGAGLGAANFTGVSYQPYNTALPVAWSFNLTAPISDLRTTVGLLNALQKSLTKDGKFGLSYLIGGVQASAKAQEAQTCPLADLIADARAQATKLASAAGMGIGTMQSISSPTAPLCVITAKFALVGGF